MPTVLQSIMTMFVIWEYDSELTHSLISFKCVLVLAIAVSHVGYLCQTVHLC